MVHLLIELAGNDPVDTLYDMGIYGVGGVVVAISVVVIAAVSVSVVWLVDVAMSIEVSVEVACGELVESVVEA